MHDPLYMPRFQAAHQLCMQVRHISFEKRQCVQRKDYSKAIACSRRILLKDMNSPIREPALDQQREEQSSRAGADDVNLHGRRNPKSELWSVGVME